MDLTTVVNTDIYKADPNKNTLSHSLPQPTLYFAAVPPFPKQNIAGLLQRKKQRGAATTQTGVTEKPNE